MLSNSSSSALPTYAAAAADAVPAYQGREELLPPLPQSPPPQYEFDVDVNVNVNLGPELVRTPRC